MMTLPAWNDIAAVTAWAKEWLDNHHYSHFESEKFDKKRFFKSLEQQAVAAAKHGDFNPLAALLDSEAHSIVHATPNLVISIGSDNLPIGPEATAIIAARLKNPRGGKRGRSRQTAEQRRLKELHSLVYRAACETKAVEKLFREYFPRKRGRHERAVDIAAEHNGVNQNQIATRLKHRL